MDLLSCPLEGDPESTSDYGVKLFGVAEVAEVLAMADLQFPVLLDNSVDDDSIVVECGPGGSEDYACGLRCD